MVGGPIQSLVGILVVFDVFDAGAGVQGILTIPEIIWELSLGIYPLIWGFRSSPISPRRDASSCSLPWKRASEFRQGRGRLAALPLPET
jgi:hypothetical protein